MKTLLKTAVLVLFSTSLLAQTDQDALNFTMLSLSGNARYVGMGGAFGALGGNMSTLSTNPAGIGIYRNSELSFTPALTIGQTITKPEGGNSRRGDLWNFNMGNFGWVGVIDLSSTESKNEWKKLQIGIGMNRLNDFWNRSSYSQYTNATYLDALVGEANAIYNGERNGVYDGYYREIAWNAYLIDSVDGVYFCDLSDNGKGLTQRQTTVTKGAINEWTFSMGGNYGDFLYLGATIGVPSAKFRQTRTLSEIDEDNEHVNFDDWKIQEHLDIRGQGINLKLGAIVKPADFIRIGVALHTPTRYKLTQEFSTECGGNSIIANNTHAESLVAEYDFYLRTPMRLIGSLGFVIAKKAIIGVEYERVNYSRMWLDDMENTFDPKNQYIENNYTGGGTLRVGAEYRFSPMTLRVGYNYTQNPYSEEKILTNNRSGNPDIAAEFSQQTFTCGVGFYLGSSTTLDFAYANTIRKYNDIPYPTMNVNQYNASGHQFLVSLGFRF